MTTVGSAVAANSKSAGLALLNLTNRTEEMNAKIENLSLTSGEIVQGGVLTLNVLIRNTGDKKISNLWTQITARRPDGSTYSPPNNTVTMLNPGERTIEQLVWNLPEDAEKGKWELKTTAFTPAGKVFDTTNFGDMEMQFNVNETVDDWLNVVSESLWAVLKGFGLGELGVDWGVKHHDTFPYFLGWFGGSIAGPFDIFADGRDCAALDNDLEANALDCGGMIISAVGSAGTILGGLGAIIPEGFTTAAGIGIMSASIKIDTAEDTADGARIITQYDEAGGNMDKVGNFLSSKYASEDIAGIVDELPTRVARKLDEVNRFKIYEAPINREVTFPVSKYEDHFAGRLDHIDEWPRIRRVLEQPHEIWKRSDNFKYWFVRKGEAGQVRAISTTDLSKISDSKNPGRTLQPQTGLYTTRSWLTNKLGENYKKTYTSTTN